jgi:hypothetical protein
MLLIMVNGFIQGAAHHAGPQTLNPLPDWRLWRYCYLFFHGARYNHRVRPGSGDKNIFNVGTVCQDV